MTKEGTSSVYETNHALFNSLWTWMRDKNKHSILEDVNGDEKYPGFDLYIHIAANVKEAIPADQFKGELFRSFIMAPTTAAATATTATAIPQGVSVIPVYI